MFMMIMISKIRLNYMEVILTVYLAGNVTHEYLVHTKILLSKKFNQRFKLFANFLHKKNNGNIHLKGNNCLFFISTMTPFKSNQIKSNQIKSNLF